MNYKCIEVTTKDTIVFIKMIRDKQLNPLDTAAGIEINHALDSIKKENFARAIVISGIGKAFSAGGDIKGMLKSLQEGNPNKYMDDLTKALYDIALTLRTFPCPVIASVNGYAMGAGMNLALSSDFIIASEKALFGQSFIKLGLIPGFGGTHLLANQLPWQKAAEIAFLGDTVSSAEMMRLGFVNKTVPHEELEKETSLFAERLAKGPTLAFSRTKELFLKALSSGFEEHLEYERDIQVASTLTEDYKNGVEAINKKETPEFIGK